MRVRVDWNDQGVDRRAPADFARIPPPGTQLGALAILRPPGSKHGFPFEALGVLALIRERRAHCAVVFDDAQASYGGRSVDNVRRSCQ